MIKRLVPLVLLFVFCLASGVRASSIVATVYPLYDLTKRLLPKEVSLALLIPPGADFHHYEPSYKDFTKLKKASLIVAVGTEPWLRGSLKEKCVVLAKPKRHLEDPHLWMDLELLRGFLKRLSERLKELYPHHASYIDEALSRTLEELRRLREELEHLSKCGRGYVVVLGHSSLSYLLKGTSFVEVALSGPHPEGEVPLKKFFELLKFVEEKKVQAVFLLDPEYQKFSEPFKSRGVRVYKLNPGMPLFPEDRGLDFFSLIEKNIKTLTRVFCTD